MVSLDSGTRRKVLNLSYGLRLGRLARIRPHVSLSDAASSFSRLSRRARADTNSSGLRSSTALHENRNLFFQASQEFGSSGSLGHSVSPSRSPRPSTGLWISRLR